MEEINKDYHDRMIEAFIDKPEVTLWYQNAFSKFNVNGVDTIKWHWSWWAFFTGFLYLLYRKQYLAALGVFIASMTIGIIPLGGLLIMILSGGFATYFVYKGYKSKLLEIENVINDEKTRIETIRQVGGYNQWVVWIYIAFVAVVGLSMIGMALNLSNM
ncbi:MAG: DUF2628 domain-containing protein [Sulfurimonas sp.]